MNGKGVNLALLALAEVLAMGLWFSASAVVPQLVAERGLSGGGASWLTMSVQLGFAAGALTGAVLNLPDRIPAPRLVGLSALAGAAVSLLIPLFSPGLAVMLVLRFLTGFVLAGVYPPGMKLVATWCLRDRGFGIGLLVGALTLGSGIPHLMNAVPWLGANGMPPWRPVLVAASAGAALGGAIVLLLVRSGPHLPARAPFDWRFAGKALTDRATRLANFGYFGHMWELYAMWVWVPVMLLAAYDAAGLPRAAARVAAFAVLGAGAAGATAAGLLADRLGRTAVTTASLVVSGLCAATAGLFFHRPILLTAVALVWGLAVVADSAQFSAAVSELTDARYVGTGLTIQTSLGFLLTLVTIRLIPVLVDRVGWRWAFLLLVPGPVFGAASMLRLRRLPEAVRMASGRR